MIIVDNYLKEVRKKRVTDLMIKKDLALSYILYEMSEYMRKDRHSPFKDLIFKGGTLLSKSHLDYHRLSEDLDFTFYDNPSLNKLNKKQRQKRIKQYLKEQFLPRFEEIVKKYNFDFRSSEMNEKTQKYCPVKAPIHLVIFNIYLDKEDQMPIKIEINFIEELFFKTEKIRIKHLNPASDSLVFPLGETEFNSYSLKEILIEKIRAVLTREGGIHERDIFDLFLINKLGYNPMKVDVNQLKEKIRQGIGFKRNPKEEIGRINKIKSKFEELERKLEEEIKTMNLKDYDSPAYKKFFKELMEFLTKLDLSNLA